jgi:tRNA(fMet)-specific endonuclease VapC
MKLCLLDTDTVSLVLRRDRLVSVRAQEYLRDVGPFALSTITCYEILRGLVYADASRKLSEFETLINHSELFSLDRDAARIAADIYAALRRQGRLIEDADLLIAATAMVNDCILVTNNVKHYARVPSLELENWADSPEV